MNLKSLKNLKIVPILIALGVIGVVCLLQALPKLFPIPDRPGESRFDMIQKVEWITYDWRVQQAFKRRAPCATNLAALFIDDDSLKQVNEEYQFFWPWPRQLYGRVVRELTAEGARAVGFDVFLIERQTDCAETRVQLPSGETVGSDEFFALQARAAGNVILGAPGEIVSNQWQVVAPASLFRTNTLAVGHASSDTDSDGVLRRAKPFKDDPAFGRVWHLGILLAAAELKLDLSNAEIQSDRLILRGPNGVVRVIPLDESGLFHIDWSLAWNDRRILKESFENLLERDKLRQAGDTNVESEFKDKLVVIGSIGSGNNIRDFGPSPLEKGTFLVSKHWNVANAILTDRFIKSATYHQELALIIALGVLSGLLTWKLRALLASLLVVVLVVSYVALSLWLFVRWRFWLPVVLPVAGALLMTHVSMVSYRVVFEQTERRRVKSIFSKIVSPDVVNELLGQEKLSLGGALCELTVLFADVRGFTQMTDENQKRAEEFVRKQNLTGADAAAHLEQSARETLATVNLYLATIADNVKKHNGTLDKYIGDCVMAFWGAPIRNEKHASACVHAAIDSQRGMYELNLQRFEENKKIETENATRAAAGLPPKSLLALLSLGTGINSGTMTVGLMGSSAHILNYTVFGREVNLASRLEGVSGRGRIIISETTYADLQKHDPALAATCVAQPPVTVKGISQAVKIYEVPWKLAAPAPEKKSEPEAPSASPAAGAAALAKPPAPVAATGVTPPLSAGPGPA